MIIGINGYAGSGKDTVGTIIQYLVASPTKDTVTLQDVMDFPTMHEWWLDEQSGWEIKKWAGKLKVVASLLTGIPKHKFEDQEFKKTYLGPEWATLRMKPGKRQDGIFPKLTDMEPIPMTVRDFLQKLGTDALRDNLHTNTWVNALMSDYEGMYDIDTDRTTYPNWIITDTRFPNEAQAIQQANGIVIRVERPGVKPINNHPSEVSLDNWNFDHTIINDSSVEALAEKVKQVLQFHKII
jgi:hypothetical protein